VTPLRFPQYHISSNRFTRQQLKERLSRADLVIVPSTSTGDDLEHFELVPRSKVRWVPLGVRSCFRPLADEGVDMRQRLNLNSPYILAVGSLEPRKNLRRLIEAFRLLKRRHRIPHKLAIVGPKGWMSDDVGLLAMEEGLTEHVVLTGFVDNELLNSLYNHADVFVYPSLYEGFGFPPLEAMAAGCPVAVSNVSSLPEVVGSAGLYFEPTDIEDIAGAVYRILDSTELKNNLISLGRSRSERYSWRNTAEATRAVYAEAMAG
jgi:glycosyltransferase involved in cell wall biosynthesis